MIVDVKQGSPEWFALRETRMTASHAQAIAANGKGLTAYIRDKMCQYFSTAEAVNYTNAAMQNGVDGEEVAAMLYEFETGEKTYRIGFFVWDEFIGASPDRGVGEDGLIEIKY